MFSTDPAVATTFKWPFFLSARAASRSPKRVIGARRRSGQDGSPQERIIAGDGVIEERRGRRENGERDQKAPHPRLSTAARSERQVVQKAHASAPDGKMANLSRREICAAPKA